MVGKVYCIENYVNNKKYIGKTTVDINKRFIQHIQSSFRDKESKTLLHKAIFKYGEDMFTINIVEDNIPIDELDRKEIFYILSYNSISPNGYNLTYGGEGGCWTEERKLVMSSYQIDKCKFVEERKKRSEINKERYQDSLQRGKTAEHSKERVWINNKSINKFVKKSELDSFLVSGWVIGKIGKTNRGKIVISKFDVNKLIDIEELNFYLQFGWERKGKKLNQSLHWVNNGVVNKKVEEEKIPEGWVVGRIGNSNKNKLRIYKDNIEMLVELKDLEIYVEQGWVRGRKFKDHKTNNGRVWISKGNKNKMVYLQEIENYLQDGWVSGKYQKVRAVV